MGLGLPGASALREAEGTTARQKQRQRQRHWQWQASLAPDGAAVPRGYGLPLGTASCLYEGPWHIPVPLAPYPRGTAASRLGGRGCDRSGNSNGNDNCNGNRNDNRNSNRNDNRKDKSPLPSPPLACGEREGQSAARRWRPAAFAAGCFPVGAGMTATRAS